MTWTIVLAGGSGTRLAAQARHQYGYARPKQFCDFDGNGTLLSRTLERAMRLSPPNRTVVITTRSHRAEALEILRDHPGVIHVEQPQSRDTTPGILLPLLHVLTRHPADSVVILPADHHVEDEMAFVDAVRGALDVIALEPERIAVLGAEPSGPAEDYGWLVPSPDGRSVQRFREKPDPAELAILREGGALVNTFVFAARAMTLAAVFANRAPGWWRVLTSAGGDAQRLDAAYDVLPPSNFSREVLETIPHLLRVVALPKSAGWTDVGTPNRFSAAFGAHMLEASIRRREAMVAQARRSVLRHPSA